MSQQEPTPPVAEFDLSGLPDEAVAYAFDQYFDRAAEFTASDELVERVMYERVEPDYKNNRLRIVASPVARVVHSLLTEKLHDMKREVEHGERADYTAEEIEAHIRRADSVLGAGPEGVSSPAASED